MSITSNYKVRSRTSSAHKLVAFVFLTLLFSFSVFAQTVPVLTLNSNVSLFNFGRFNTGTLSPNTVITISNGGTGTVFITGVAITGTNSGDFTLVGNTCAGVTLTTVGTCTATIRFNPLAIGVRTANLTVTDNANGSQHLVPLRGTGLNPAIPNKAVGPIDPRIAYPLWYRDELGTRLTLCLDASGFCIAANPEFNPAAPASVTTAGINFPDEAFYSYADARINRASGGNVRLVIATEAAFTTPGPVVGQQITFERIRVRIDQLTPGAVYTITHPFGVMTATANADGGIIINSALKVTATASTSTVTPTTFTATPIMTTGTTAIAADPTVTDMPADTTTATPVADGGIVVVAAKGPGSGGGGGGGTTNTASINTTEDIGCGSSPCDFRASLDGKISRFLSWDTGAPAGYIGNPNVLHTITGSPFGTNIFKVDGPNVGGAGINTVQTNLFTIAGKLF